MGLFLNLVHTVRKWNEPLVKNKRVLVCSDNLMSDFYIDNADTLIHYDIPESKKLFSSRFSVLQDSNNMFIVSLLNFIILSLIKYT